MIICLKLDFLDFIAWQDLYINVKLDVQIHVATWSSFLNVIDLEENGTKWAKYEEDARGPCWNGRTRPKVANVAVRDIAPPTPRIMTEEGFLLYMDIMEERNHVRMENQAKFFQEMLGRNQEEKRNRARIKPHKIKIQRPQQNIVFQLRFQPTVAIHVILKLPAKRTELPCLHAIRVAFISVLQKNIVRKFYEMFIQWHTFVAYNSLFISKIND